MKWKKKRFLLRKTEAGSVGWTVGPLFCIYLGILLCAGLQIYAYQSIAGYLEDALAASNLAAAVLDIEEYGSSHRMRIMPPEEAYDRYLTALQGNLNLDAAMCCRNRSFIEGRVTIERFMVYNVEQERVEIYERTQNGSFTQRVEAPGAVWAPDGTPVEKTGIYSEVSCRVKGVLGLQVPARKGKLADIAENEED